MKDNIDKKAVKKSPPAKAKKEVKVTAEKNTEVKKENLVLEKKTLKLTPNFKISLEVPEGAETVTFKNIGFGDILVNKVKLYTGSSLTLDNFTTLELVSFSSPRVDVTFTN